MRTRCWTHGDMELSSTIVQVRDDTQPMVWIHSNIGWMPCATRDGEPIDTWEKAVAAAEAMAKKWNLPEVSQEAALYWAGEEQ